MSQAFSPDIEETTGISPPRACSNTPGFVSMNENPLDTAFTSANIQAKYHQVKDSVNTIRLSLKYLVPESRSNKRETQHMATIINENA